MRTLLLVILIGTLGAWYYHRTHAAHPRLGANAPAAESLAQTASPAEVAAARQIAAERASQYTSRQISEGEPAALSESAQYRCDGRTSCPQMHSCAEAKWMLQHCSGMKMDGDDDGVPCETQWCN